MGNSGDPCRCRAMMLVHNLFFSSDLFASANDCPVWHPYLGLPSHLLAHARPGAGRRLGTMGSMVLASASAPSHSSAVARGSSSSDIATASNPVQLWKLACRAAARNLAGTPRAFAFASWRTNPSASAWFGRQPQRLELQVCTASRRQILGTQPVFCDWRRFARRGPARARPLAWAPRCEWVGTPTLCQRRPGLLARMAVHLPTRRFCESPPVASPQSCCGERRCWQHVRAAVVRIGA